MYNIKHQLFTIYARAFARRRFEPFNQLLVDFGYRGLGILNWQSFRLSGELFLSEYLEHHYDLETVLDVGANKGRYTENYIGKAKHIFCFEPLPRAFRELQSTLSGRRGVSLIQKGLSETKGESLIYDYDDIDSSSHASLYQEVITDIHQRHSKAVKIELTTVDEFVEEYAISKISLLKIDTEGNELAVLKGAKNTLAERQIDFIHIEFNEMNVISRSFMRDFVQLLRSYNMYRLLPRGFLPIKYQKPVNYEIFAFQNIVAIRSDIDKLTFQP